MYPHLLNTCKGDKAIQVINKSPPAMKKHENRTGGLLQEIALSGKVKSDKEWYTVMKRFLGGLFLISPIVLVLYVSTLVGMEDGSITVAGVELVVTSTPTPVNLSPDMAHSTIAPTTTASDTDTVPTPTLSPSPPSSLWTLPSPSENEGDGNAGEKEDSLVSAHTHSVPIQTSIVDYQSTDSISIENEKMFRHVVVSGESLYSISIHYGVDSNEMGELNNWTDLIHPGDIVIVPIDYVCMPMAQHTVVGGDTVSGLSLLYDVPIEVIVRENRIDGSTYMIRTGQTLTICL